jgi:tRNA(Ile)-lysidine synthetase-like protein
MKMLTSKVLDYKFGEDNVYLLPVTYGAASMALLDMMQKEGKKPVVCFVNYHFGEDIDKAETALKQYCQQNDLTLEICDTRFVSQEGKDDDYIDWQRKTRYNFFTETYKKYDAAAIFIAHIQDDIIESYLRTKADGIKKINYGYTKISQNHGMVVVRPLLDFTRQDLQEYCEGNNVPFLPEAVDFEHANSSSIRKHVDSLNEVERGQLLDEMKKENSEKINFIRDIDNSISEVNELEIRAILALNQDEFLETLINFVNHASPIHITITPELAKSIRKMCLDKKSNMSIKLKGDVYLVKEYDIISIDKDGLDMPYSYVIEKPGKFSCESFDLDFSMGAEDRNIKDSDYPLTVRSALPQDNYNYGGYLAPVRRMLVAAGISPRLLHIWPVFLNKDGKIIYVPRYKKGFSEYHSSVLNIHVKNDEK